MEQPKIRDLYRNRETEVPLAEKQRLFSLTSDVLWFGDTESKQIPETDEGIFVDSEGELTETEHFRACSTDKGWSEMQKIDVRDVYIDRWPERTSMIMTYPDQINVGIFRLDGTLEFFTLQAGLGNNLDQVQIGNRIEMRDMKLDWLELSASDAARVDQVMNKVIDILYQGLATP